jgi:acyl-CoA synthetase (AMP-forming)/AMP-acid ligase II
VEFKVDIRQDNLGFFFCETAAAKPDKTALIDLFGGKERTRTYSELDRRTDRVAALLAGLGLAPGDRLALMIGNRLEYLEIFFGAMRAGIVPVPLNTKQGAETLDYMIRDSGSVAAVVDTEAVADGIALVDALPLKAKLTFAGAPGGWTEYERALAAAPSTYTPAITSDGIAFQAYTAGSTGRPKGVRLTHAGMLWSIRTAHEHWPMSPDDVGLVAVPLFHKNAMRGTIKPALYAGATSIIMPRFEPRAFLETAARYRVTYAGGVPAIFSALLDHKDLLARLDFSSFKMFAIGSAVVSEELVNALERVFPSVKVKESYGLTEAGGPLRDPLPKRPVPRGSCGVAAPGCEVKLVGPDGAENVTEGELWTRNPCVTAGYHNLPELTRAKIIDGWLRTGDIFRVDAEGFYYFMGRVDDMFSCGGENIYPKTVEDLLLKHPAVREACVVAIPHASKGFVPAAAVIPYSQTPVTPDELKDFCLQHGPAFAHPRRVMIIDAFPMSGAGKPDRKAIQRQLAPAAP